MNYNKCASLGGSKKRLNREGGSEKTLRIRYVKHLGIILGISTDALLKLAENVDQYYRKFKREVKGKDRSLVEARGLLKAVQRRILDNLLLRLPVCPSSFGGVRGRSIKDNAAVHAGSKYIVKLDIRDFYPSIHSTKVYRFFHDSEECTPDVAHILTALTTYKYCLPLGTSTSPMLADQIVRPIDVRVNGMANKAGLKYSRYVDDIALSGSYPLGRMSKTVLRVLKQNGFKTKKDKLIYYKPMEMGEDRIITGVRVADGRISAPLDYVRALESELRGAIYESGRGKPSGEYHTREHYRGKITYIKWLDPELGKKLIKLYRKVKWRHLEWAKKQG